MWGHHPNPTRGARRSGAGRTADTFWRARRASGAADQDAGGEDERAADHDLERRAQERRVHVAVADPGDDPQLAQRPRRSPPWSPSGSAGSGTGACGRCRRPSSSARRRRRACSGWPRPVSAPSSDSASAKPIEMPAPIDAARPTRNVLQVVVRWRTPRRTAAPASTPSRPSARRAPAARPAARTAAAGASSSSAARVRRSGAPLRAARASCSCARLGRGEIAEQLPDAGVGGPRRGPLVEPPRLQLHRLGLLAHGVEAERAHQPERPCG